MQKVNLLVDSQAFNSKPNKIDAGTITKRIPRMVKEVSAAELADLVGNKGHTMVLATMRDGKRGQDYMVQQQVLALDFDNSEKRQDKNGEIITYTAEGGKEKTKKFKTEGLFYNTLDDIYQNPFIQENAAFIYKTFSYHENWEKFRVVFILDEALTQKEDVKAAYSYLLEMFPLADSAPTSPASIFYGGIEAIEINFNNVLSTGMLPKSNVTVKEEKVRKPDSLSQKAQKTKAAKNTTGKAVWELLQEGRYEEVKEVWAPYSDRLHSKRQAMNYIKLLPMNELLGLPTAGTFHDIFHDEENPSAGIYQIPTSKTWMYKCHSSSESFDGDIFKVVGKLTGKGYVGAINLIIDLIPIKIEVTDSIRELRESWGVIQEILLSEELKRNFPEVHSRFWRYKTDINTLIDILKENVYEDSNGELRALTYLSTRRLAVKMYGSESRYSTIIRILNLMDYTNWIDKLDEEQIPNDLLKKLKAYQAKEKLSKRSNVFELTLQGDENVFFEQLNLRCEEMKEKGITMKTLNREGILATDGKQIADKVFVQDKDRGISKKTEDFYIQMCFVTEMYLKNSPFIEQNQILEELSARWGKSYTENTYKKMLPRMLQEKGYKKNRLTKSLIAKWGIEQTQSFPTVLYA